MYFEYLGNFYNIKIIRKNNKNTYIRFKDNEIVVTTNYLVSDRKIRKLIEDNKEFIEKSIERSIKVNKDDDKFKLFGKSYDIIYIDNIKSVDIEDNKIYAKDKNNLDKYLSKYIYETYLGRIKYWSNIFKEKIPKYNLKIRQMKSRWGVCNIKNKNVTLNLELSKYDIKYLDYVIVHELAHFIYPNHSKNFWLLVSKYCSNYKDIRKDMKEFVI